MTMPGDWTLGSSPITFTEFGIGLMPDQTIVHLITPDFLVLNQIVPEDWALNYPVIANRAMAEIAYGNGLVVKAEVGEIGFIHATEEALPGAASLCARVARQFVRRMFGLGYESVRFDTYGFVMLPEGIGGIQNIGSPMGGELPIIGHEARYNLADGLTIEFFAHESSRFDERFIDCVDFRALSTYVAEDDRTSARHDWVDEVISNWEEPLHHFVDLVKGFWELHLDDTIGVS